MQVFISHIDPDKNLAKELGAQLGEAGFNVWNPYEKIYPGDNWEKETGKALEDSEIMAVLLTRAACGSETLLRHVQFALTSGNYRGKVVPVLVNMPTYEAGRDIPWILVRMNPVHVDPAVEGWSKVVQRVQSLAEKSYHAAD